MWKTRAMDNFDEFVERSPFERLGGEERLRSVINSFIDRVTSDSMIGFFFRTVNQERLREMEYQLARHHLGGGGEYEGRPLQTAHGRHAIFPGHFNRRIVLLEKVLEDADVPMDVRNHWLDHDRALRAQIEQQGATECVSEPPRWESPPNND
jgi:truncated hemoglobin YjbI